MALDALLLAQHAPPTTVSTAVMVPPAAASANLDTVDLSASSPARRERGATTAHRHACMS